MTNKQSPKWNEQKLLVCGQDMYIYNMEVQLHYCTTTVEKR